MSEYPIPPGFVARSYYDDALSYRRHAHMCFRIGGATRAEGRDAMRQAIRCWKRFRLWMERKEHGNGDS